MWRIGLGKADITHYEHGMWMFGWGMPENRSLGVQRPLHARALVLEGERRVAMVVCDLGFVSQSVQQAVAAQLPALGLHEADVLLCATHTHSGPNGFSDAMFYAATAPGFSRAVHDGIVEGILAALVQAVARLAPGRAHLGVGTVPASAGIAFHRAPRAHNRNPGVEPLPEGGVVPVAVPMTVLRLEDDRGRPQGLVAWFPLHGTCIHADNTRLHPDHKGVAAEWCERRVGNDFVALFPQESAGDLSPNAVWDPRRKLLAGPVRSDDPHADDLAHAERVGEVEGRYALTIATHARTPLAGPVGGALRYADLSSQPADPRYTGGVEGLGGAPARNGLAFAHGTAEGPGPLHGVQWLNTALSALTGLWNARPGAPDWLRRHGAKYPWYDLGHGVNGRVLGFLGTMNPVLDHVDEPRVAWYRDTVRSGVLGDRPWLPQVLPAQILRIGTLTIAALPQEPTTVAGRRIAAAVGAPGEHAVVTGYANAYAGYLVTPEEYEVQHYEAACTMFGRWSLPAWCTALAEVRAALDAGDRDIGPRPPRLPPLPAPALVA